MKNGMPKFSVLVTVYKNEKAEYFDRALNSIETQTLFPDEIVIVKDGRLSASLDLVMEKHIRKFEYVYKIISLEKNHGRGYASKVGIEHISNSWFARMDSDDISLENRFELQIKAIQKYREKYSNLAAIGGQINEFSNNEGDVVGYRKVPLSPENIKNFAAYRSPINNPTVMINKSALINIGNYSSLNVLEDYDLWIRFLSKGYTLINIPDVLVNMRVGNGMYTRRGGFKYLVAYVKQKKLWKSEGIGNNKTVLVSSLAMICNTLFPTKFRKYLYQNFLHKNRRGKL